MDECEDRYTMYFSNHATHSGYDMGVYQIHQSANLDSLIWKVVGLGTAESTPYVGHITWKMNYTVSIMEQNVEEAHHYGGVSLNASLGTNYKVVLVNRYPQILPIDEDIEPGEADEIVIENHTDGLQMVGFGLDGSLLASSKIEGGERAVFIASDTYHVAAYHGASVGSPLVNHAVLKAVPVEFEGSTNIATLSIKKENNVVTITGPSFRYEDTLFQALEENTLQAHSPSD